MITFKIILEYDGTRYSGWQDQKNARTVMGELYKAAGQVFRGKFEMQGAGRKIGRASCRERVYVLV